MPQKNPSFLFNLLLSLLCGCAKAAVKMRHEYSRLIAGAIILFFFGCEKIPVSPSSAGQQPLIDAAQRYYNETMSTAGQIANPRNYRANLPRSLDWRSATVEADAVIVPLIYNKGIYASMSTHSEFAYSLSDIARLVVWRDSSRQFRAMIITYLPDSAYSTAGTYLLEDWQGNSLATPTHLGLTADAGTTEKAASSVQPDVAQSIQVCNQIDGYNYSPDDPSGGVAWSETSCTTYNLPAQTIGPRLPPVGLPRIVSPRITPAEIVVAPPTTPIANIADYFSCFTNGGSPDHSYSVEVCVDQPDPGTRDPWGLTPGGPSGSSEVNNAINSGHTFLVLTENDQGNITTRNVGFYPSGIVVPAGAQASSQGMLNNDQSHGYNISLTINVNSTQFFNILNYVSLGNNQGYYYNLNTNNCTTFVIDAAAAGGVVLPSAKGSWPGGSGNDPGDLGQDIMGMTLSPNMARNTVSNPHPNTGICN
jgi:hypothetical protein